MIPRACCCNSTTVPCDHEEICLVASFVGIQPAAQPYVITNSGHLAEQKVFAGVNGRVKLGRPDTGLGTKPCLIVHVIPEGSPGAGDVLEVITGLWVDVGTICNDNNEIEVSALTMARVYSATPSPAAPIGFPIDNTFDDQPYSELSPPFDEAGNAGWGGTGTIEASIATTCPDIDEYAVAVPCSGVGEPISVDLSTNVSGKPGFTYGGVLYTPLDEVTTDPPVTVVWVDEYCTNGDKQRPVLAHPCDGLGGPITIDPNTRPVDGVTFEYLSKPYIPSDEVSSDPPVAGTWLTTPCPAPARYLANPCGNPSAPVAYQLAPGMAPGEGICVYTWETLGPNGLPCTHWGKFRCTTNLVTDTSIPLGTQKPGICTQPHAGMNGDCGTIGNPTNPCDLPIGHPQRPPGCPGSPALMTGSTPPSAAVTRSLPVQDIDDGYDPETSGESPKVNGGCGCSPPEGVD